MIANSYERHKVRVIFHESRNSTSLQELKEKLEKNGIKLNYETNSAGMVTKISFQDKRDQKIDFNSVKGKDRVFTDLVQNIIKENAANAIKAQANKYKPDLNRIQRVQKTRDIRASLERQNMFSNKIK